MSQACKDLVRQANSSRINHAYNALIEIRKKYTKSNGVQALVSAGLVPRLVELLRTRESLQDGYQSKVLDVCLSILANMCMQEEARQQVLKVNGVMELGELFLETSVAGVLHRSCRCLANILLTPRAWEPVHSLAILEKLAELLNNTDNDDCRQTYIRTVRLLGQTPRHVGLLVDNNLVYAAARLVDSENKDVSKSAFRCVHSLSVHGCSAGFAQQIVRSGKVGYLLGLLPDQSSEVFPLICKLAEHVEFRPQFGNDGGITDFIKYFQSSERLYVELRVEILNVLCLCCQESVNRMKLRENGALKILLESLKDDKFKVLHNRIVSAFVCFRYDEQGFQMLLDGGLVAIVRQLFTEYMDLSLGDTADTSRPVQPAKVDTESAAHDTIEAAVQDSNVTALHNSNEVSAQTKETAAQDHKMKEEVEDPKVQVKSRTNEDMPSSDHTAFADKGAFESVTEDSENSSKVLESKEADKSCHDLGATADATRCKDGELAARDVEAGAGLVEAKAEQRQWPKYSIDSPTYESVALQQAETGADGPTCIESFTPPHGLDHRTTPYSPLSTSSYYSPSSSSPDLSGDSSETSSRGGHTPRCSSHQRRVLFSLDSSPEEGNSPHKYTGLTWSPESSPERPTSVSRCSGNVNSASCPEFTTEARDTEESPSTLSKDSLRLSVESDSIFVHEKGEYSPVVDSQDFEMEFDRITKGKEEKLNLGENQTLDAIPVCSINQDHADTTNKLSELELEKSKEGHIDYKPKRTFKRKRSKKRKASGNQNISFEMNILQILSRVQDIDPILYIVTLDMMNCLFNYLCKMETPLTRVAKILSRTFRDRHCFPSLLNLHIPALIFDKLIAERDLPAVVSQLVISRKMSTRVPHWPEIFDFQQTNSLVTERFSLTEEEDQQPCKRSRFMASESDSSLAETFKANQPRDVCCRQKCQVAFLEDLATVVDSQFSCGVIERIILTSAQGLPPETAVCIPLLSWSKESRKFYLKYLNITDQLLKLLETWDLGNSQSHLVTTLVLGFGFLARTSHIETSYLQPFSSQMWNRLQKENSRIGLPDNDACMVQSHSAAPDDELAVFLVEGEKLTASRTVLTEKSSYFSAMLTGAYKEASMVEIPLPETSKFACEYLVHHAYGCSTRCPLIQHLHTAHVCRHSLKCCTDLLAEADKHLLPQLRDDLIQHVIGRFLVPECAWPVFEFAVVTDHVQLQKAAVACLLAKSELSELRKMFCEFLESRFSQVFLQTIFEIFTEW